jgi:hypothetical protein
LCSLLMSCLYICNYTGWERITHSVCLTGYLCWPLSVVCSVLNIHEGVSKSFRTGRLARELQMVQPSATKCICIATLWISLVSFAAITLCVASQRMFIVISLSTQSGNFWIHFRTALRKLSLLSSPGDCHCTTSYVHLCISVSKVSSSDWGQTWQPLNPRLVILNLHKNVLSYCSGVQVSEWRV